MFDFLGGLGSSLSGLFSGVTGAANTALPSSVQGIINDTSDIADVANLTNLQQTMQNPATNFNAIANTNANVPINQAMITKNINGEGGVVQNGLGLNMDTLMKLGSLGLAWNSDKQNRKDKRFVMRNNARKDQNARERSKSLGKSIHGSGYTQSGQDYETSI